jgi:hypothetical protein
MALIHELIPKVMKDLGAIGKDRENSFHKYNFRGIDDVYNAVHEVLVSHGVFTVPVVHEHTFSEHGKMMHVLAKIAYYFYASDGSSFQAVVLGEGADSGDKSANKAMAAAHKYALIQVFSIPTKDAKDSENDSPVLAGQRRTEPMSLGEFSQRDPQQRSAREEAIRAAEMSDIATKAANVFLGSKVTSTEPVITDDQREVIKAHFKRLGWSMPHASNHLKKHYGVDAPGNLPAAKYEECIAALVAYKVEEKK